MIAEMIDSLLLLFYVKRVWRMVVGMLLSPSALSQTHTHAS